MTNTVNRTSLITVRALRPLEDDDAAHLRSTIPHTLANLVGALPDATLHYRLAANPGGEIRLSIAATTTAAEHSRLASELLAVVERFGVVDTGSSTADSDRPGDIRWPLVPAQDAPNIGFASTGDSDTYWSLLAAMPASDDETEELLTLISQLPDVEYHVEVRPSEDSRPLDRKWDVSAYFTTHDASLPLRLRAFVSRCLPGLRIPAEPAGERWLVVPQALLAHLFRVPVAGAEPLSGVLTGPPPALPVVRRLVDSDDTNTPRTIRIGRGTLPSGVGVDVELAERERLRHLHIVGRTGTGKSSLLAAIAHGVAASGDGGLILDPHGHLIDRIVAELPESAIDRTWVIRAGDAEHAVPINPLAVEDPVRRDIVLQDFNDMFYELFDPGHTGIVGPRFEERLTMAMKALIALRGSRATLLDAPLILSDEKLSRKAVETVTDPRVKAWWDNDHRTRGRSSEHGELVSWFSSKFNRFDGSAAMRASLGTGADAFDPATAMDDGRLILVDLSKGKVGELASRLLGFLYISRFWSAALQRTTVRPFTVMVDEVQSFSFGALPDMLSEGRKFGLSVVVCHQYLNQLDAPLREAIAGNTATTIAFRTSAPDAAELSARLGGLVGAATLTTLPDLTAVSLRAAGPVAPVPHTVMIDHNRAGLARTGDDLAAVIERVTAASNEDLVEPHRGLTTLPEDLASGHAMVAGSEPPGTLVKEWLAKRKELQRFGFGSPADIDRFIDGLNGVGTLTDPGH